MDTMISRPDMQALLVPAALKDNVENMNTPELFGLLARLGVDVKALLRQEIAKDVERKFMTVMCMLHCACTTFHAALLAAYSSQILLFHINTTCMCTQKLDNICSIKFCSRGCLRSS